MCIRDRNIAIVGATGNVGRKIIEVLENKNFPISELYLIASSKSSGQKINFKGKEHTVIDLEKFNFIKKKYGQVASWAVWKEVGETPKSNMGDLSILDPQQNPDVLSELKPDIVFVGLNVSRNIGDLEPFYRETVEYVGALRDAGIEVEFKEYPGCFHAFDMFGDGISEDARNFTYCRFADYYDRYVTPILLRSSE